MDQAIAALEQQRGALGDAVTDAAIGPLRAKLAAVESAALPEQTLRLVTVLFLDVVGSTALAQRLDAEDVHAVLDGLLARCTGVVQAHGGKVLQYAGDSLLAVFGADSAREDDVERAVRCGLALLGQGGRQLSLEARRAGLEGVDVRIGVHTGRVLLGGGVDAEHSIRGSTVHVAARMEQTAPTGGLRISHDTYRHVHGIFDVLAQPPLQLKGLEEPLATYLVQRAKPREFHVMTRGIEGVQTRMIGRDFELRQLQDAFHRVLTRGRWISVNVVADAGLGKSRLLHEFHAWIESQPVAAWRFLGRAHPQTQDQPHGLLRDVLARHLRIADADSMEFATRQVENGIAPLFEPDAGPEIATSHAHVLAHLIGLDFRPGQGIQGIGEDVRQLRDRGLHVACEVFRRTAAINGAPVVLLLDDLHFADEESLDFLHHLHASSRDVPMLVASFTRPTLFERRGDRAVPPGTQRIDLRPLDDQQRGELTDALLQRLDRVPPALRELVAATAQGNPFYMEELIKMLIDVGAIQIGAQGWSANPDRLAAAHVPQTLTGVIQARLDQLQPAEKLALQQASVIGAVFWDQALAAIDAEAPRALPRLEQRELAFPHPHAAPDGLREYAFKHQILHRVTYDTVLKSVRRRIHAIAAAWFAGFKGARANHFLGAAAEHYEEAGNANRACEFFARAAEHARVRFAHDTALAYAARGLALLDADAPGAAVADDPRSALALRWRLLDVRERSHDLCSRREEQRLALDAMQTLADALADDGRRAEVASRRAVLAMRTGDFAAQEQHARQAMSLAGQVGNRVLQLRAQRQVAAALASRGDTTAGKALARQGLASALSQGLRSPQCAFLNTLSVIASIEDDQYERLELLRQLVPLDRELGNLRDLGINLGNLGAALLSVGLAAQAQEPLDESLRISRSVGDRLTETYTLAMLSEMAGLRGDTLLALALARSAVALSSQLQSQEDEAIALCTLGATALAADDPRASAAAFERAYRAAAEIDDGLQYDALAGMARAALAQGDLALAMVHIQPLLACLAEHGGLVGAGGPRLAELTCFQVLTRAGDARAAAMLTHAHGAMQAKAARIGDAATRDSFLTQVPEHREIEIAWARQQQHRRTP